MKKLLILLLLMGSTNSFAEWTKVSDTEEYNTSVYIDFGTIKRKGNKVKMWSLYDNKTAFGTQGKMYLSMLAHSEYDCEEDEEKTLDDPIFTSENMGRGTRIFFDTGRKNANKKNKPINQEKKSVSIVPDTIQDLLFKIACGKK